MYTDEIVWIINNDTSLSITPLRTDTDLILILQNQNSYHHKSAYKMYIPYFSFLSILKQILLFSFVSINHDPHFYICTVQMLTLHVLLPPANF